ncbi:MAG: FkbM family methyltransferase [Verrucomicrobiota bacterium]|jgi:FkbM family methyltransferase
MNPLQKLARATIPRPIRNWLRSPITSLHWGLDELRFRLGLNPLVELRPGFKLRCHPAALRTAYRAQVFDPDQIAEFDSFIQHCRSGMVFFDIGAHFGLFSMAALRFGGATARAVAVDPSPMAVRMMSVMRRLNGISNWDIIEAAVSDHSGYEPMVSIGVQAAGYFIPAHQAEQSEVMQVQTLTLDELMDRFQAKPTHIKIDVEGFEEAALAGATRLLSIEPAPILFLELHHRLVRERQRNPAALLRWIEDRGFHFFSTAGTRLEPEVMLKSDLLRVVARRCL